MKLSKIIINSSFKLHPPRNEKMLEKKWYLEKYGEYKETIIVNENNELIDGYTTYLLALENDKKPTIKKLKNL